MQRYFFDCFDGIDMPDVEGTELPSLYAAQSEAFNIAQGLIMIGEKDKGWHIVVRDEAGRVAFRITLSLN